VSPQPGGVDVRFEAGLGGTSSERGMGLAGMAALIDQDPNGNG
jgi:hypothetical protein